MICRIWHGWTTTDNADPYENLLRADIFPRIEAKGIAGLVGMDVLRRPTDSEVEFVTILWFDALAAVKAFAGDDYEAACGRSVAGLHGLSFTISAKSDSQIGATRPSSAKSQTASSRNLR